jgi:superfamily II DNA/RNA helicase
VRDVLFGRREAPADLDDLAESCHRRLLDAARRLRAGRHAEVGGADLAVLLRHALRREQARLGVSEREGPTLTVPNGWPAPPDGWQAFALVPRADAGASHTLLEARPWWPDWLAGPSPEPPLLSSESRRYYGEDSGADPFLGDALVYRTYRCPAQRQAVHATLSAPPGSTLAVLLPTGAGKSLCAYLPALLRPDTLTVVVVPTVSLALDQERALAASSAESPVRDRRILHPTAHVGGADEETRQRNAEIRRRMRRGQQRLVFTSPEALLEPALAEAVYTAARAGQLQRLVIDEAHIVDQWGDDFRAAFQELAGLRRDLLSACPRLRTLLLSATITEGCLDTLETLFGDPGPFRLCAAVQLRPEPEYFVAHRGDDADRRGCVLDALYHLPRPLILYVNRRRDADDWLGRLRQAGFRRAAVVTGDTDTVERAAVIHGWQEHALDLVVATSAFGMGVDKDDVRCVLHACVPESVDRFYQEVGRGGRDGHPSLSLVVTQPEDWPLASQLNRRTVISAEYGLGRWRAMYAERRPLSGGRLTVPLDAVATYRFGETDGDSRLNMAWNARTLTLMARAGLILLDAEAPGTLQLDEGLTEAERQQRLGEWRQAHVTRRVLRIRDERHLDEQFWGTAVEASRSRTEQQTRRGLHLLRQALEDRRCLRNVLTDAYAIAPRQGDRPRQGVEVAVCCSGCPGCRPNPVPPAVLPIPVPVWDYDPQVMGPTGRVADLLDEGTRLALFDRGLPHVLRRPGRERDRRHHLLMRLLRDGVRNVVAPPEVLEQLRPAARRVTEEVAFFFDAWSALTLPRLPTLVVHLGGPLSPYLAEALREPGAWAPPLLLWAPPGTTDPARPDVPLEKNLGVPTLSFDVLAVEVGL